jgi:ABC-2 type transport system permease protein
MADATMTASHPTPGATRLPAVQRVVGGQVWYQLLLLMRNPRALMAGIVMPGLLLALRLGRFHHASAQPAGTVAALVAGLIVFGILGTAYLSHAASLVIAREDGVLRRWRATPLPTWGYFTGRIAATVLAADASALVLVLVGVSMAGLHVTAGMAVSLLIAATLGGLAWAAVGTAVTAVIPTAQSTNPVLVLTFLPVLLFSGSLGDVNGLPQWLTTAASYLPAQPVIDAATRALSHTGPGIALLPVRDLLVLMCWTLAGLLISVRFFRWNPHRPSHAARR